MSSSVDLSDPVRSSRVKGLLLSVLVVVLVVSVAVILTRSPSSPSSTPEPDRFPQPQAVSEATSTRPNVIFILTDDLDKSLMKYLPHVQHLIGDRGAVFSHYYVEQSTCCPSRSTILTGKYAHNTRVFSNTFPSGGYFKFRDVGNDQDDMPTWFAPGYTASLEGKYLNEYPYPDDYQPKQGQATRAQLNRAVPPGWDDWAVPADGQAYKQTDYRLNVNGVVDPRPRATYLDSLLGQRLLEAVSADGGRDYARGGHFFQWSSYSPHLPYAHPEAYNAEFKGLRYPQKPSFNEKDVRDKFGLARSRKRLGQHKIQLVNSAFRNRVRSVQVLDAYVAKIVAALKRSGAIKNTYLVFSSDNGLTMGEHRLPISKYNQFQETINVPLMIRGPGIKAGRHISTLAGNIDLAPTFADMAGTPVPKDVDGRSLLGLLHGSRRTLDRPYLLIDRGKIPLYRKAGSGVEEPNEKYVYSVRGAIRSSFVGVVGQRWKYIKYTRDPGRREEVYDLLKDPYEQHSLLPRGQRSFQALPKSTQRVIARLRVILRELQDCQGVSCRVERSVEQAAPQQKSRSAGVNRRQGAQQTPPARQRSGRSGRR